MPVPTPGADMPSAPRASMLAAGVGGAVLVVLALPSLFRAVVWSVFDPGSAPRGLLAAMVVFAVSAPVTVTAVIAFQQRSRLRVSVLLVAVPQVVLFTPLLVLQLLARP